MLPKKKSHKQKVAAPGGRLYEIGILSYTLQYGKSAGPYYNGILSSILEAIESEGYSNRIHIRYIIGDFSKELKNLDALLILGKLDIDPQSLLIKGINNVITIDYKIDGANFDAVVVDFKEAIRLAFEAFNRRKVSDIYYIGSSSQVSQFGQDKKLIKEDLRTSEFRSTLAAAGESLKDRIWLAKDFTVESGYSSTKDLLKTVPNPGAILYGSGEMAIGGYKALQENGLSIGSDVLVISIDDMEFANYMHPPLTSISINIEDIGKAVVFDLIARLNGRSFPLTLNPSVKLIPRKSC
ncbi:substrate-binding domain-containing protein [Butyrivibrio sp. WCD3002]|uniref:substrate-binding domain-containing protein n=1 Tax=Butyrivibrio sp. WCD3002 TaxID=1280676 RepID=UPI0003FA8675|nr:substrate-binding domain-containing protein [Butyrivibrio sp. WCD3002]